jgi:hypothetical protein
MDRLNHKPKQKIYQRSNSQKIKQGSRSSGINYLLVKNVIGEGLLLLAGYWLNGANPFSTRLEILWTNRRLPAEDDVGNVSTSTLCMAWYLLIWIKLKTLPALHQLLYLSTDWEQWHTALSQHHWSYRTYQHKWCMVTVSVSQFFDFW